MGKLLAITFLMALLALVNIFKYLQQKHGQDVVKVVKSLEHFKRRLAKVNEIATLSKNYKKRTYNQLTLEKNCHRDVPWK